MLVYAHDIALPCFHWFFHLFVWPRHTVSANRRYPDCYGLGRGALGLAVVDLPVGLRISLVIVDRVLRRYSVILVFWLMI